jgi:hypothetical protein
MILSFNVGIVQYTMGSQRVTGIPLQMENESCIVVVVSSVCLLTGATGLNRFQRAMSLLELEVSVGHLTHCRSSNSMLTSSSCVNLENLLLSALQQVYGDTAQIKSTVYD